jgi:hypothetical protein
VIGAPAVHIEADVNLDEVATIHATGFPVSFYHRYSVFNDAVSDHREPLPTAWSMRYEGIGTDFIDTSVMVWKGSTSYSFPYDLELVGSNLTSPDELVATNCLAYTYYAWDEDENVVTVTVPAVEINEFPLATQRMDAENLQLPGADGWMLFAWPPSNYTTGAVPPPDIWQTWMGSVVDYAGVGSIYRPAHPVANWGCFSDQVWPGYGVNYPYLDADGYRVSPGNRARIDRQSDTE